LALADDDAAIAPLGTPGAADRGEETLLAGRFNENQVPLVHSTVTDAGGDVVADVDERWTLPRQPVEAAHRATSRRRKPRTGNSLRQLPIG
jgi:hypothetical protein